MSSAVHRRSDETRTGDLRSGHRRHASSPPPCQQTPRRASTPGVRSGHWQSTVSLPASAAQCRTSEDADSTVTASTSPPAGRCITARILMLDDSIVPFRVQPKSLGSYLFQRVSKHLNLLESDYFGLEYQDCRGIKFWLDLERPMIRQVALAGDEPILWFCVKFYTPDPVRLEEEYTRYLFALQVKRDLRQGLLQCNNNTAALMVSYIMQAECGDHERCDSSYLRSHRAVPRLDEETERRILESHRRLQGQTPPEADLNLLETARRCELYGIKMNPAKDHESVPLNLAVTHMGVVVFHQFYKINLFSWAKIRKLSFKRRRFLIKLHPEGYGYYKDTVDFFFATRNYCKNFWKKCVEHHGFFRCPKAAATERPRARMIPRGSGFRFTGRTQKQMIEYARDNVVKRHLFHRSQSFRSSTSLLLGNGLSLMGASLSAQPLIPTELSYHEDGVPPMSLSFGSVTFASSTVALPSNAHTERDAAELDTTSRGELSTSAASSPAPAVGGSSRCQGPARLLRTLSSSTVAASTRSSAALTGRVSPESEISSTLTDSLRAARLSRSSRSLSESAGEVEAADWPDSGVGPVRRRRRRLQPTAESSSCSSVNDINTVIDRRQTDTASHHSYDLLEAALADGWSQERLAVRHSDDDDDDDEGQRSDSALGEVNLIPYGTPARPRPVLLPDLSPGPVILPPESFLGAHHLDGVRTLPRAAAQSRDRCPSPRQTRSTADRLEDESVGCTPAVGFYRRCGAARGSPGPALFASARKPPLSPPISRCTFVEVHQLPSQVAFSSHDDSLDDWLQVRSATGTLDRAMLHYISSGRNVTASSQTDFASDVALSLADLERKIASSVSNSSVEHESVCSPRIVISPSLDYRKASVASRISELNTNGFSQHWNGDGRLGVSESNTVFLSTNEHALKSDHRRSSSPQVVGIDEHLDIRRRGSLPDSQLQSYWTSCLIDLASPPPGQADESSDKRTSGCQQPTTAATPPRSPGGAACVADHELVDELSTLSDTTSRTGGDESTLQYDTVPDESEPLDVEAPPGFGDQPPPALPPSSYRIAYQPLRALSRISERSTTSEMDSRLSTPTTQHRRPPRAAAVVRSAAAAVDIDSCSSSNGSCDEADATVSPDDPDFPSPPSSLLEQPVRTAVLPASEPSPPPRVVLSAQPEDSHSCSSSDDDSRPSEQKALTAGVDSDQDAEAAALEDLPGDDEPTEPSIQTSRQYRLVATPISPSFRSSVSPDNRL